MKLLMFALLLTTQAVAQFNDKAELYYFIENEYAAQAQRVAAFNEDTLNYYGLSGNAKWWALMHIAKSNMRVGLTENAAAIIEGVPVGELTHGNTFLNVQFTKARIFNRAGRHFEADSIFSRYVEWIPRTKPELVASTYTNWANTKTFLNDRAAVRTLYYGAVQWNRLYQGPDRRERLNKAWRNLSRYYQTYEQNFDAGYTYFARSDTAGLGAEERAHHVMAEGYLLEMNHLYTAAETSYIQAQTEAKEAALFTVQTNAHVGGMRAQFLAEKMNNQAREKRTMNTKMAIGLAVVTAAAIVGRKHARRWWLRRNMKKVLAA